MSGELQTIDERTGEVIDALTAAQVRSQVNRIQEIMKSVMQDGQHFGKIPGCGDKPTLLKPGAEKLMMTFRLVADPVVEDLSTLNTSRYRVKVRILTASGVYLGAGVGEASSDEEKYRWRKAVCEEEWNETPEDKRREKWFRGKEKPYKVKQIKMVPDDVANTVLKMAKKRGLIDGVLTVTGASDIFTQDIEDLPEEMLDKKRGKEPEEPSNADLDKEILEQESKPEIPTHCACGLKFSDKALEYYQKNPKKEKLCYQCNENKKAGLKYGKDRKKEERQPGDEG